MAIDYLTIPGKQHPLSLILQCTHLIDTVATSVDVERLFSKGRLVLSHVRNRLSAESTRASLCVGSWSRLGLVRNQDVLAEALKDDVEGPEPALAPGWDAITQ